MGPFIGVVSIFHEYTAPKILGTYRSITIGIHQLPQRCVFFDFKLHNGIILT